MAERDSDARQEILIVEDERLIALEIKFHLKRWGYGIAAEFSSGEDALEFLAQRHEEGALPSLVLMDIQLSGEMDGVGAAIVARERFALPVVVLTAYADEKTLDRAKLSEPYAYIIKPINERELKTALVLALYRNRMERAIRSRERLLSGILASIHSGVVLSDADGAIQYANRRADTILNRSVAEAASIDGLFPTELRDAALSSPHPVVYHPESGPGRTVEVVAAVIGSDGKEAPVEQVVWVLEDITARIDSEKKLRQKDEQLAHASRMDAVGRMSGGLAHDFSNLMTVIMGCTRLIIDDLETYPELASIEKNIAEINRTARRSATLIRQLLAFSRVTHVEPQRLVPDTVISEMRTMIDGLVPEDIDLQIQTRATAATVHIDRSRMEQIVLNLVLNARDAMPLGGSIGVSTRRIELADDVPTLVRDLRAGSYFLLRVSDNGEGIRPEDLPYVFEPFFTTKESELGSGFGLATVYSAVDEGGGGIDVSSTLGQGSTFSIYLPDFGPPNESPVASSPQSSTVRGDEMVLVVQEEEVMRSVIGTILRSHGFAPVVARSVGEGLLLLEKFARIEAIISDLSAPFFSAAEIVRRYRRRSSNDIAIILATGRAAGPSGGQDATLMKPFEPEELLDTLRDSLDRRKQQG